MYQIVVWRSILGLGAAVLPSLATANICSRLKTAGIEIDKPFTISYASDFGNYWSAAYGDLKPDCIAAPSSVEQMPHIVKELHGFDTLFAVKSGGHMPNDGFARIQGDLLISTKNMNQVYYSEDD